MEDSIISSFDVLPVNPRLFLSNRLIEEKNASSFTMALAACSLSKKLKTFKFVPYWSKLYCMVWVTLLTMRNHNFVLLVIPLECFKRAI